MSSTSALRVAAEVLQVFKQLCAEQLEKQDVPPNIIVVFAEVAANPGRSLKEYGDAVSLGQAVVSRSIAALGRGTPSMGRGLGLVTTTEDPENFSRKIVTITDSGKLLLEAIDAKVGRYMKQRPGKE